MHNIKVKPVLEVPNEVNSWNISNQLWYEAISTNDVKLLKKLLDECSTDSKKKLLNGSLVFETTFTPQLHQYPRCRQYKLTKPICIAAACGAIEVLKELIQNEVDVLCTDRNGYNVIHAIIGIAAFSWLFQSISL